MCGLERAVDYNSSPEVLRGSVRFWLRLSSGCRASTDRSDVPDLARFVATRRPRDIERVEVRSAARLVTV
jgi:hypothetical protein